jgi:hypothetical protein
VETDAGVISTLQPGDLYGVQSELHEARAG